MNNYLSFRWIRFIGFVLNLIILLSGVASSGESEPFIIPKQEDITLFANKPQGLVRLDVECHVPVDKARILSFFKEKIKVYIPDVDIFDLGSRGQFTLPKKLSPQIQAEVQKIALRCHGLNIGGVIYAEGALLAQGKSVYFWRLFSDDVLLIWREDNAMRALVHLR